MAKSSPKGLDAGRSEIKPDDQSGCLSMSSSARPNEGEVPAEVQFEVAPNAVTDIANLRAARLRTWQGQQWKEQVDARLELASLSASRTD